MKRSILRTAKGGRVRWTRRDEGRGRQAGRGGESRRNDAKTGHDGQIECSVVDGDIFFSWSRRKMGWVGMEQRVSQSANAFADVVFLSVAD